jgi:hypothetical protein
MGDLEEWELDEWTWSEERRIKFDVVCDGQDVVNEPYPSGFYRIHRYADNVYLVSLLLSYGANINQLSCTGDTPLMYAICSPDRNIRAVEYLLDSGADPNIANNRGSDAFDYVLDMGGVNMVMMFLRRGLGTLFTRRLPRYAWKHANIVIFCLPKYFSRFHKSCWLPLDCVRLLLTNI